MLPQPVAKLNEAVPFLFPGQTVFTFIAFVATAGAVSVGLGEFVDMDKRCPVGAADVLSDPGG